MGKLLPNIDPILANILLVNVAPTRLTEVVRHGVTDVAVLHVVWWLCPQPHLIMIIKTTKPAHRRLDPE
jgi:hypothetical protein